MIFCFVAIEGAALGEQQNKLEDVEEEDGLRKLQIVDDDAASVDGFSQASSMDADADADADMDEPRGAAHWSHETGDTRDKNGDSDDAEPDSVLSATSGTVSASVNRTEKRRRVIERKIRNSRGKNRVIISFFSSRFLCRTEFWLADFFSMQITPVVDQNGTKFICPLCNEPQGSQRSVYQVVINFCFA